MDTGTGTQPLAEEARCPNITESVNPDEAAKPKRKIPNLDDPYEHALPKPDGDPWAIVLKPAMEMDKIQCEAWKEEVQTLLIFAGLFSAVVTAFIIESYKFLQPDPNDTIINLLTQIANGPNVTATSSAAGGSMLPTSSFMQKSSSVRINVFWFISLILSLATVLVGTIALQWLREHQAYPGLSPKQTLAILHMRTESLKAWYVPQMFAMLPLLLQGALVLFLAGLIDFTLPLGQKLSIPITCIVGFILLFLAATTILPAFQSTLLFSSHFSRNKVPSPCAYKSPQSQVFHTFTGFVLHALSFIWPMLYCTNPKWWDSDHYERLPNNQRHLFPHIYLIWAQKLWATFDLEWLSVRDAWHNHILDKDEDLYHHREAHSDAFPLSDITQYLTKLTIEPTSAKHTEEFCIAAFHCFKELSENFWIGTNQLYISRHTHYFEQLTAGFNKYMSIFNFLVHDRYRAADDTTCLSDYIKQHSTLFYLDHILPYGHELFFKCYSQALADYLGEVASRMVHYLLHPSLQYYVVEAIKSTSNSNAHLSIKFWEFNFQYSPDILATLVENVASIQSPSSNSIYTHVAMQHILSNIGIGISVYLTELQKCTTSQNNQPDLHKIGIEYGSTFQLVATYLNNEITVSSNAFPLSLPNILFFHIAMIIKNAFYWLHWKGIHLDRESKFNQGLAILVDALANYKTHVGNQCNDAISKWSKNEDYCYNSKESHKLQFVKRFSQKWWASLFYDYACCYSIEINPEILHIVDLPKEHDNLPLPTIIFPSPLVSTTSSAPSPPSCGTTAIMFPSSTTSPPQEIVPVIEAVHPNLTVHYDSIDAGAPLQSIPSPDLSLSHLPLSTDSHLSPKLNIATSPHPTESHAASTPLTPGHPQINTSSPEELTPKPIALLIPASTIDMPPGARRASSDAIRDSSVVEDTALAPTAAPVDSNSDAPPANLAINRVDDTNIVDEQVLTTIASASVLISSPESRSNALPENAQVLRIGDSVIEMKTDAKDEDAHKD